MLLARLARAGLVLVVAVSSAGLDSAALAARSASGQHPTGLPSGAPPAATRAEPALPRANGWPFPEAFPRTSGTGRLKDGASFWTDFVYDDHGALGVFVSPSASSLAPHLGTYTYPEGPSNNNGADIFRAAIGLDTKHTYWRVDWTTLVERDVPVAVWAFDTDPSAQTGAEQWPAGAGVRSAGVDRVLIVSGRGAWLLGPRGDRLDVRKAGGALHVDMDARSFVVRVPRRVLPVSGRWRVRLAAGLADRAGAGFASVPLSRGARPGGPAVYNVAFRTFEQEPPRTGSGPAPDVRGVPVVGVIDGNLWNEAGQAEALANQDVSRFFLDVGWADLAARRSEPEPVPSGYSVRWYVTRLKLGQGVVQDESGESAGDLRPNYRSRVQPYAVYVPSKYRPDRPVPLTWVLHSLGLNHNQYGATTPRTLEHLCERRGSICATPLGFGPDGWYMDEAEVNFWEVWNQLATHYRLDPDRTVISGYSMGGYGSYRLGLTYPDLFAKAMPLAGPPACGARLLGPIETAAADPASCARSGDTKPLVANARWLPHVIGHGALDELVPVTGVLEQVRMLDTAGYRYRFHLHPAEDHVLWSIQDAFSGEIADLGKPERTLNPGLITYLWYPDHTDPELGLGPTGAYWVRGLQARTSSPGVLARVEAVSHARPDPRVITVHDVGLSASADLAPAVIRSQTWRLGPIPEARPELSLDLVNVADVGVDMPRAGLVRGTVFVSTDGPTVLRLLGLPEGTEVASGDRSVLVGRSGVATIRVPGGRSTLAVR